MGLASLGFVVWLQSSGLLGGDLGAYTLEQGLVG